MLKVHIPESYAPERAYVIDVLLGEFLGLSYELYPAALLNETVIADDRSHLSVSDIFFQSPADQWLKPALLPKLPLDTWTNSSLGLTNLPVLYGHKLGNGDYFSASENGATLGLDLFGSVFFLLTRYEEIVSTQRDSHDRFPSLASMAAQANFLMRPLVNEYLEVLWAALTRVFPRLERKSHEFRLVLSHDVDQPFGGAGRSAMRVARSVAGDLRKGRPLPVALERVSTWLTGDFDGDPCNTFDYLMRESEKRGLVSAFYFICGHSGGAVDGDYELAHPRIQSLMQTIHERGHEIGLHPSYNTFRNAERLRSEYTQLRDTCSALGIAQKAWGGRQHYLRWQNPITWQLWNDAGLAYDSSLTFSDSIGFRAGVCYEYPVYNLETRTKLALRERPLLVMEASLWDYMAISETDVDTAAERIMPLLQACKRYGGDFTLLWYNHNFRFDAQKRLYEQLLNLAIQN